MANSWFRMYSEFADDPKVQMMPEAMQRRLLMLMCSKCKGETLHETELAFQWRVTETDVAETKVIFLAKGFIDEHWNLLNWDKRQFISDSSTDRVRRFRQGKKQGETLHETEETNETVTVTAPEQNRTDTEQKKQAHFVLPDWIEKRAWDDYLEMRVKIKRPMSERSKELAVGRLEKLRAQGKNPTEALEHATFNSWQGIWDTDARPSSRPQPVAPKNDILAEIRERDRKALEEVQRAG